MMRIELVGGRLRMPVATGRRQVDYSFDGGMRSYFHDFNEALYERK